MTHTSKLQAPDPTRTSEALVIRIATEADGAALRRLAQRDCAPLPRRRTTLVAEVGGELRAAQPLDGGPPIADPFQRTAHLTHLLAAHAEQIRARPAAKAARRPRLLHRLRPAPVTHA